MKLTFSLLLISILLAGCRCSDSAEETAPEFNLNINDLRIRDPFIFANTSDSTYYLHANSGKKSIICYASRNLKTWRLCGEAFSPAPDFWGKYDFWAPDLYYYRGKYYMLVTFSSDKQKRGVSILVSDRPDRGFTPVVNNALTNPEWMCIDGSLYIDKEGNPWLIYCHEWVEVNDGKIYAQRLAEDLTGTVGEPILLFKGSDAAWTGMITSGAKTGTVANSPYVYTAGNGRLVMIWSSYLKNGEYAVGQALSDSGNILGPWKNSPESLNNDGGHAMIFYDFNGQMLMSYHTNEHPTRIVLRPIHIIDGKIMFLN